MNARRGLRLALAILCCLFVSQALRAQGAVRPTNAQSAGSEATAASSHPSPTTPATPLPATPTSSGGMPTPDRLAPPPTVQNPTQADEGAQAYWLNCQPCHGDRGQGLTDEWRAQYPEDHQNCWTSGCHGERPYENGFTLPTYVPPLTGPESLQKFEHMGLVYNYIRSAMPYNAPGGLSEEEYLAITAYLAREHDVWDGVPLQPDSASRLRLRASSPATATPPAAAPQIEQSADAPGDRSSPARHVAILVTLVLLVVAGVGAWWRKQRA